MCHEACLNQRPTIQTLQRAYAQRRSARSCARRVRPVDVSIFFGKVLLLHEAGFYNWASRLACLPSQVPSTFSVLLRCVSACASACFLSQTLVLRIMQEAFKFRPGTLTLVPVPAAHSRAEPRTCFGQPRHPLSHVTPTTIFSMPWQ